MKAVPQILAAITIVFSLLCFSRSAAEAQRRPPNILVIVTDDMGYGDIGIHGSKDIPTPNIDALAKVGIRFTDAYVSGPYCSPTRAGLLTGRYPQRFGHEFNLDMSQAYSDFGLPLSEPIMADRLKAAGYRTALVGKWHLGFGDKFHPMARGFDEFFGFLGHSHSYLDPESASHNPVLDGRKVVVETPYLTDAFADRAVAFIKRQKSHPFFLYLAFNAVHAPMQAADKYLARFRYIADEQRRTSRRCGRKGSKRIRWLSSSTTTAGRPWRARRSMAQATHLSEARNVRLGKAVSEWRSSFVGEGTLPRARLKRAQSFNSMSCPPRWRQPA